MQDTRRKQSDADQGIKQRQSEATSKETLEDLDGTEKDSGKSSVSESIDVPAPDGEYDEKRRDDPAGPM